MQTLGTRRKYRHVSEAAVYVARDSDRDVTDLFAISVADGGFANDVLHHFGGAGGLQFRSHAAQGDTQNIPVM